MLNESQINRALSKVDNYISINQEFPGYFDAVINSGKEPISLLPYYWRETLPKNRAQIIPTFLFTGWTTWLPLLQHLSASV